MNSIKPTNTLVNEAGIFFGEVLTELTGFDHPGAHRIHQWDLSNVESIAPVLNALPSPEKSEWVEAVLKEFCDTTKDKQADFNDANIILHQDVDKSVKVTGVIDFGDSVYSARINDIELSILGNNCLYLLARRSLDQQEISAKIRQALWSGSRVESV